MSSRVATPVAVARQDALAAALSSIARAAALSLELKEVFARIADASRAVLPFDTMGVSVVCDPDLPFDDDDTRIAAYATAGVARSEEIGEYRRADISPALRLASAGCVSRHADVKQSLDPAFLLDRRILGLDCRSLVACLLPAAQPIGSIWFAASRPNLFTAADETNVLAIADLVALALQHDRLFRAERERQRRSDVLEALLPTLSKALDIRDVFDQLSSGVAAILPHDRMGLGLFSDDRTALSVHAYTGARLPDLPPTICVRESPETAADCAFFLVRDLVVDERCTSERYQTMKRDGIRSMLRVPVRQHDNVVGCLSFLSRTVGRYRAADADVASRIADQVALVLSHERLAEEARVATAARAEAQALEGRLAVLTERLASYTGDRPQMLGNAKTWRRVLDLVSKVAPTATTVLLTGESGTGKEVVARAIHSASERADQPFFAINCAALPELLLESELFGHERGAFTGAVQARAGTVEQAKGGVLFLDEVGEMSTSVQAKFLRLLQEREFQRLGGSRVQQADVRVIAATNRDLVAALGRGEFREDLFYRLSVFEIDLPPLRERRDDILILAEAFADEISRTVSRPCAGISKQAQEALLNYGWPGNVRELRNAIERAIILCEGGLITGDHLPAPLAGGRSARALSVALPAGAGSLADLERTMVTNALRECDNNKSLAARRLGITRSQLYSRLHKYGIAG